MPFKALGLSPDQEKAVHAALDKHRPAEMARHKAAFDQEQALHAALEDPATTETQLRALNLAAADARLQALLEHHALVLELNAILTPEQQAKARRIRDAMRREMEAHRALMEETGGPGKVCPDLD
jgi:Spy/CpxP family protein refolding chaperone